MNEVRFIVEGDPVPWERARTGAGWHVTPPKTRAWQTRVKVAARQAKVKPTRKRVRVWLTFYRASKRRCDWDNLAKSVCDALNGIAWVDDTQIHEAHVTKHISSERPHVSVTIQEVYEVGRMLPEVEP